MTDLSIPVVSSAQRRTAIAVALMGNFVLTFGFQLWQSLFNNFAVQELGLGATQIGWVQSVREIPGLLGLTVGVLALFLDEMRIAGLSIVLMGIGLLATGGVGSMPGMLVSTFVMSTGFHFFVSSNASALLILVETKEGPHMLGRLSSVGALAALAASGVVLVALKLLGFRTLFYAVGALVIIGGLVLLPWSRQPIRHARTRQHIPIRRQYWLYYAMEFLLGSRRHIFVTFALYLMVKEHQVSAQVITILFVVNSLIGAFLYPQFGKIIARFGERRVLTLNFAFLIFVFLGYAYIPWLSVLYVLFVADQVLFGFSIAVSSYFQKIAVHPQEITPNLSLGQTINHIAAVVIPVAGGIVWEAIGGRYTFLVGVGVVVTSLFLVQWMRTGQDVG